MYAQTLPQEIKQPGTILMGNLLLVLTNKSPGFSETEFTITTIRIDIIAVNIVAGY